MTAAGTWTYTLDNSNAAVQALNVGGHLTDTFTVTTADGTAQIVTVTIDGSNDAAVISGTSSGTVVEAGGVANGTPGTPTATGTLTDTDVDNAANSFTVAAAGSATDHGYGTFQMTAAGTWTYTLDNSNAAVQALNNGQSTTDTFTVHTVDGTAQVITITIDGTDDVQVDVTGVTYTLKNNHGNEIDHNAGNASGAALIDIHFSQNVSVTGTPTLSLNVGAVATYVSGSGSQDLIFSYTPSNSGNQKTTALAITGVNGTISDTATNTPADTSGADVTLSPHLGVNEPPAPAGTAGSPINLALENPPSAANSLISLTFSGVPLDWHLNHGTDLGNGVWSVQTNDVSNLTITTPANYTGAVLLHASEEWTSTDGSHVSAIFGDNVEAFAPGSSIFAWSGSDTLTGTGANDLFCIL